MPNLYEITTRSVLGRTAVLIVTTIFIAAAITIVIDTLLMSIKYYQPLFSGDGWNTVDHYEVFKTGDYDLSYLFSQHNEHRIVFPRFIFLADFVFANGLNKINIISVFIIQFCHFIILTKLQLCLRKEDKYISLIVISSILILLFSLGQHENFYWGFQVQFVGVYAAATLAFWCFARSLESRKEKLTSYLFVFSSIVMALIATYSMSNGIISLMIIFFMSVTLSTNVYLKIFVGALIFFTLILYFHDFHLVSIHSPPGFIFKHPAEFISYFFVYLGGPIGNFGYSAAGALGAAGLLFTLFAAIRMTIRGEGSAVRAALVGVMLFIVITGAVTAFGRAFFGLEQALSSRYFTPSAVFWSAQIIYWSSFVRSERRSWPAILIFATISVITVSGAARAHFRLRQHQEKQFHDLNLATDALLSGVGTTEAADLVVVDLSELAHLASFLDQQHLSIFSWPEARLRGMRLSEAFDKIDNQACLGSFDDIEIPSESRGVAVSGWAWNRISETGVERIILVDSDDMIVGFASGGWNRSDVPGQSAQVRNKRVGWKGFASLLGPGPVRAYAYLEQGRIACLIGARAVPPESVGLDMESIEPDFSTVGSRISAEYAPSGGWTMNGQHPSVGAPPIPGLIYGSWSGADANQGEITIGPFNARRGTFVLPIVTGPSTRGQAVTVKDATSGAVYLNFRPLARSGWMALHFTLPTEKADRPLLITVTDRGSDAGQWIAIGEPHAANP